MRVRVGKLVVGLVAAASALVVPPAPAAAMDLVRPVDPGYAGQWGLKMTRVDQA